MTESSRAELDYWQRQLDSYTEVPAGRFAEALESSDPRIVWAGVRGSALKSANRDLVLALSKSDNPVLNDLKLRTQIAWALAQYSPLVATHELTDGHSAAELTTARRQLVADYIGESGQIEGLGYLGEVLEGDDDESASWAALSLAKLGGASLPIIERGLKDRALPFRRKGYLVDALGRMKTPESSRLARDVLASPDMTALWIIYESALER